MKIKAFSIKEPWASMIYNGKKTIETRTWKTDYRGELLLCASKKPESDLSGCAFATCILSDIHKMTEVDVDAACCTVYPNAYAWMLDNIHRLNVLFPVKGKLSLFDVDTNVSNREVKDMIKDCCENCCELCGDGKAPYCMPNGEFKKVPSMDYVCGDYQDCKLKVDTNIKRYKGEG